MDLASYKTLTGLTVSTSQETIVTATITRTQKRLEAMLGYPLSPTEDVTKNYYSELGISTLECPCSIVSTENLNPADEVVDSYRLYFYNPLDAYLHIDPCLKVNSVKLVHIQSGGGTDGITVKKYDTDEFRVHYSGDYSRYVQILDCGCIEKCDNHQVQLAVDAEWAWADGADIPEDILYLWADMVTYYSDGSKDVKSESIESHSYTREVQVAPELEPDNIAVLQNYVGPKGKLGKVK